MYLLFTIHVSATIVAAEPSRELVLIDSPGATGINEAAERAVVHKLATGCCIAGRAHARRIYGKLRLIEARWQAVACGRRS